MEETRQDCTVWQGTAPLFLGALFTLGQNTCACWQGMISADPGSLQIEVFHLCSDGQIAAVKWQGSGWELLLLLQLD